MKAKNIIVALLLLVSGYIVFSPLIAAPLYSKLLFFPDYPARYKPKDYNVKSIQGIPRQELYIPCANGNRLHAWFFRYPGSSRLLIVSHGNAGNLSGRAYTADELLQLGNSVLLYDYQGYGLSDGTPSISNICQDGQAVFDYACRRLHYRPEDIVLYGESLGCAVSCEVAKTNPCAGIILQGGWSSLKSIAAEKYLIFYAYPDFLFPKLCLDNVACLKTAHRPLLILHGQLDRIVPIWHAECNYRLASAPKRLVVFPNSGHYVEEIDYPKYVDAISSFLAALPATNSQKAIDDYSKAKVRANKYFVFGKQQNQAHDYDGAMASFSNAISLNPNFEQAYFYRAVAHENLRQYQPAIDDYTKAIELAPNYAWAYNNRGAVNLELGQYQKTIEDSSKAIEFVPNYAWAYTNRGVAYHNLGDYKKAIENYSKAIELDPKDAVAYNRRGIAYYNLGQCQKAIEDYSKAISLDPKGAVAYTNRGLAYHQLGQYQKAIEDYSKAIELNPRDAAAYTNRGMAYHQLGQYQEAMGDCSKAIELDPKDAVAYTNRGVAYRKLGQYQKAIEDYSIAIGLDPKNAMAYNNRGDAYDLLKQYTKCIDDANKAINLDPKMSAPYATRGWAYYHLGQHQRALDDLSTALALDPKFAEIYYQRAQVHNKLGQLDLAKRDKEKAKELGFKPEQK